MHEQFLATRGGRRTTLVAPSAVRLPVAVAPVPAPMASPAPAPVPATAAVAVAPPSTNGVTHPERSVGPAWSSTRTSSAIHSSGRISELFGPRFAQQDDYELQCRMPEPPLLLADRVVGLDGRARRARHGARSGPRPTSVADAWYLNDGCMPAGFMIEAGQADLLLISYMGIDLLNRGERVVPAARMHDWCTTAICRWPARRSRTRSASPVTPSPATSGCSSSSTTASSPVDAA